jgi:hypothetical protein
MSILGGRVLAERGQQRRQKLVAECVLKAAEAAHEGIDPLGEVGIMRECRYALGCECRAEQAFGGFAPVLGLLRDDPGQEAQAPRDSECFCADQGRQLELVDGVFAQIDQGAALIADGLLTLGPEITEAVNSDAADGLGACSAGRVGREDIDLPAERLEILRKVQNERGLGSSAQRGKLEVAQRMRPRLMA